MFSFQGAIEFPKKFNEISCLHGISVNLLKEVVGQSGLEPPTSRLSVVCSNQLSYWPTVGGDNRDRTDDPLLARQVLSQLSYTPIGVSLVGPSGLEPPTSRLSVVRSSQLSYGPVRGAACTL